MEGQTEVSETTTIETEAPANAETITETQVQDSPHGGEQKPESKPEGFDRVEFTPEQKARVDRIYGNMKRYENDAKEQRTLNQQLIATIEQIHKEQSQIVSHIQVNDYQGVEARLNAERDAAWAKGDYKAFTEANDKIHEAKTQRLLAQREAAQKPQLPQKPVQPQGRDADRIVNSAIDQGEINPVDANIARSWMAETDAGGNLKRPWTQATDPRNYSAALEGQAVFNSPAWADKPIADKLREIDRRMGLQTQPSNQGQNVLGAGNLTRGKGNNTIKLTPDQERIATKTKFAASNPKLTPQQRASLTDRDHIEAYKQAVVKSQPKGAAR